MKKDLSSNKLILVVEDEERMTNVIRLNLELEQFRVVSTSKGLEAVHLVKELLPDCVILDLMLPDVDGFEVLRMIRQESNVPVIVLTARGDEEDIIHGLQLGADNYVKKPFNPRELVMHVKALLRRAELPAMLEKGPIRIDDRLVIDFEHREVIVDGQVVKLRPTESRLLYHLVQNAGKVVPTEELLSKVWGWEYRDQTQYLRLYINYLRQKIEPDPDHPRYILTERGFGYRFMDFRQKQQQFPSEHCDVKDENALCP